MRCALEPPQPDGAQALAYTSPWQPTGVWVGGLLVTLQRPRYSLWVRVRVRVRVRDGVRVRARVRDGVRVKARVS